MGELLLRKALACRDRIARLRRAIPADPEAVRSDEMLEAFLGFHVLLLVQDAIDIAAHLVALRGLALPASHRESFEALAKAGIVSGESAAAMGRIASLRNRIAHTYGDLDSVRMVSELPTGLDQVSRFLDEVTATITDAP